MRKITVFLLSFTSNNMVLISRRVIVDDEGSRVVFNGLTPLVDALYTSTSNYITG